MAAGFAPPTGDAVGEEVPGLVVPERAHVFDHGPSAGRSRPCDSRCDCRSRSALAPERLATEGHVAIAVAGRALKTLTELLHLDIINESPALAPVKPTAGFGLLPKLRHKMVQVPRKRCDTFVRLISLAFGGAGLVGQLAFQKNLRISQSSLSALLSERQQPLDLGGADEVADDYTGAESAYPILAEIEQTRRWLRWRPRRRGRNHR